MAENSKIEWTDHTFNAWRGCTKVSDGCKNCYADTLSKRNPKVLGVWGPGGTRVLASEQMWREPLKWNEEAKTTGVRRRVFCASLADVFEGPGTVNAEGYAVIEEGRRRLFALIEQTPNLDWLLLTKRPENIETVLRTTHRMALLGYWDSLLRGGLSNVWIGTSVENQAAADKRIPELLKVPAVVRFLSCEPLLGPVDLERFGHDEGFGSVYDHRGSYPLYQAIGFPAGSVKIKEGIDWVIAGGESGPNARPMHPDWARSLRDQCEGAGVAFFFKQHGEWLHESQTDRDLWREFVEANKVSGNVTDHVEFGGSSYRVGKAAAGRLLDGRTWDELPEVYP